MFKASIKLSMHSKENPLKLELEGVHRLTARYILRAFALQHPCRISVICFVTALLFSYLMNESM